MIGAMIFEIGGRTERVSPEPGWLGFFSGLASINETVSERSGGGVSCAAAWSFAFVRLIGGTADLEEDRDSLEAIRFFFGEMRSVAGLGAAVFSADESAVIVGFGGASFLVLARVAMNLSL